MRGSQCDKAKGTVCCIGVYHKTHMCLCYVEFNSLLQGFTVFALFTDNWLADFDSTFIAVEGISGCAMHSVLTVLLGRQ
jgi:hypothetical protein